MKPQACELVGGLKVETQRIQTGEDEKVSHGKLFRCHKMWNDELNLNVFVYVCVLVSSFVIDVYRDQ